MFKGVSMKQNKLVIFDCYGVVLHEMAPFFFANHFSADEAKKLKEEVCAPADLGQYDLEAELKIMAQKTGLTFEAVKKEYYALFKMNQEMVDYIRSIKDDVYVAMVSNAPNGLNEYAFELFHLDDLFENVTISHILHIAKPDRRIFEHCIQSFNKKFDQILFIDDNTKNFKGVEDLGITPLLFDINETAKGIEKINEFIKA